MHYFDTLFSKSALFLLFSINFPKFPTNRKFNLQVCSILPNVKLGTVPFFHVLKYATVDKLIMWKRGLSPISHFKRSLDKALEQGMRCLRRALVLGMELGAYEEGMNRLRELHDLGQAGLGIVA